MFKLLIADDEGKTTVVPLVRDEITIGRKEGNTIRLTERNISRKHAKLKRANGAFVIEDLSSYNGVKVNGKKISAEIALKPGDQVLIGDYQLALQLEGESGAATIPEQTAPSGAPVQADAVTAMISAPAPGMGPPARLVMMSPPAPGAEYALSRDRMRIGRAEDLEIWVNHRSISREHAEVVNEGGRLFIKDLASANGLRVNGSDTRQHELRPGDVIELGQVRFRYVPAGEAFTFDEGRTMQMEAIALPPEREAPNRTTLYIAGGILCVALLAGAVIIFSGGSSDDGPMPVPLPPTSVTVTIAPPTTVAVAVPTVSADEAATAAVAACSTALNTGDVDGALARAAEALTLRPGDQTALDCQARATAMRDEGATFSAGLAQMQAGDYQAAYLTFESLPVDSAYRARPEVVQTMTQFATQTVAQAEGLQEANPTEANRLAATVLVMTGIDPTLTARADAVERATHPRGVAVRPPHTGPRLVPMPPPSTTARVTPPPSTTTRVAPPPSSTAPPPATSAASGGTDERLNACVIAGDNHCVVDLLGHGRAHGTAQLRMLFNAQRALSMRADACATAAQLITAPGVSPALQSQYRQYRAAQCQ